MSDFLTEQRREVVGAHGAHARRRAPARRLRAWRPATLLGAAAAAALLVAVVLAVRSLEAPEPSREPRVIKVLRIGGIPVDGVLAGGALWVSDSSRSEVVRIDPDTRRVAARIPMSGNVRDIAAGDGGLWVRTSGKRDMDDGRLVRIDPRSNRIADVVVTGPGDTLAVGGGAIWIDRRHRSPLGLERIDAGTGAVTRRPALRDTDGISVANGVAWVLLQNGRLVRLDAASGRILPRSSKLAETPATADASDTIAADAAGVWLLRAGEGAVFRFEGERMTRRLAIDTSAQLALDVTRGGLWVAAGDELRGRFRAVRIDPVSGKETASVDLGEHRPQALVPVPGGLWAVCGDGTAVLIDT